LENLIMAKFKVIMHRVTVQEATYELELSDEDLEDKDEWPTSFFEEQMPNRIRWKNVKLKNPYFHEAQQLDE
tara:strand:+ start:445 stop:660 length:216 start_codon:yes stop_codon:yes gene_type:complete